jgi:hypothetical protein
VTQRERVLRMLRTAGRNGVRTGDFLAAGLPRFSARLIELREDGHQITGVRESDSSWRYTLIEPHRAQPAPADEAPASLLGDAPGRRPGSAILGDEWAA